MHDHNPNQQEAEMPGFLPPEFLTANDDRSAA
jgi:hypothetical protein